jgi:hypothetical protein
MIPAGNNSNGHSAAQAPARTRLMQGSAA